MKPPRLRPVDRVRHRQHVLRVHGDELRLAAAGEQRHHALARRHDLTGALEARDVLGRARRRRVVPGRCMRSALLMPAACTRIEQLAVARHRVGPLLDTEPSVADDHGTHRCWQDTADEAPRHPPRDLHHRRRAAERRVLHRTRSGCGWSRRRSTRTTRPSTTSSTPTRTARRAPTSRSSSTRARPPAARATGWCTASCSASAARRRSTSGRSASAASASTARCVFTDPEGLELELIVDDGGDAPLVARHPEIPEEHALRGFAGVRAYASNPERSGRVPRAAHVRARGRDWESRGDRHGFYVYDEPPTTRRGIPGAGTVHHVAWSVPLDEHAGWVQKAAEAGARPTPVIDRFWFRSIYFREPSGVLFEIASLGPGLHDRRGPRAPRREADPAAGLRAPARAGRAGADAAARARARDRPRAAGERRACRRARALPRPRRRRERPLPAARRARPASAACTATRPRGPLSLPPGGAHWYVVPRVGYPDPDDVPRVVRRSSASGSTRCRTSDRRSAGSRRAASCRSRSGSAPGGPRPVAIAGFSGFIPVVDGLGARPRRGRCRRSRSGTARSTR